MRLVLDPGHGGGNSGCAAGGVLEKTYTLQLALTLSRCVTPTGTVPFLTRQGDVDTSLEERGAITTKVQPALVAVLHLDSSDDPSAGNLTCYAVPEDAIGRAVGEEIERAAPNVLRPRTPETILAKPTDWTHRAYNCLQHHAPYPAVLIECGFVTNPKHATYLQSEHGRLSLVAAIMAGIGRGYELTGTANAY